MSVCLCAVVYHKAAHAVMSRHQENQTNILPITRANVTSPTKAIAWLAMQVHKIQNVQNYLCIVLYAAWMLMYMYPLPRKEFNIQVLQEFVRMHKFHSLDLVAALRAFLGSFTLPGEAQKIDRMMESFAQRYCQCNPGLFSNTGEQSMPSHHTPHSPFHVQCVHTLVVVCVV